MVQESRVPSWPRAGRGFTLFFLSFLLLLPAAKAEGAPPMKSQKVYVPVDLSSGAAFGRGDLRPYAVRARGTPAFGLGEAGRVRLGAEIAGVYENPRWFFGYGPALSVRVLSFTPALSEVGVLAVVDHMWWRSDRPSTGAALIFDLDGMLRLGLRVDRDWLEESTIPQLTIGVDLPTLFRIAGPQRSGEPDLPFGATGRRSRG